MNQHDDLGDSRSRDDNRRRLENAARTRMVLGRWLPVHPFRATPSERIMFAIGCVILLALLAAFVAPYLGLVAPFQTYAELDGRPPAPPPAR